MRRRDNFYFYFSIASLLFIFVLIYYFYEKDYKLSLNINTILTVLGTVFGAYFGARVAGKYAVESVEKQIESNDLKDEQREKRKLMRAAMIYKARMEGVGNFINSGYAMIRPITGHFINFSESLEILKKHLEKESLALNEIDISEIWSDEYYILLSSLEDMKRIINLLNELINAMNNDDEELYFIQLKLFDQVKDDIQEDINMLNKLIGK